MSNGKLKRTTIRIPQSSKDRMKELMKLGEWMTNAELFRHALNIGLTTLEKKHGMD